MPAKPSTTPSPQQPLETYRLEDLGYELPESGDWLRDQLNIEFVCFRIAHPPQFGGLGKFGHFRRIVDLLWNNPDLKSQKRFVWNPWAERMLRKACECNELVVAGCTSAGKSDPLGLWVVVNFIADPTHFLGLIMSTTLSGAKKRIWKTVREYYEAVPDLGGKPLWSVSEIQGPTYDDSGFGQSSGIYLMASEQSNEKTTMDKLIGLKAPRTGVPDDSLEALMAREEFEDLVRRYDKDTLADLLPRLVNLTDDRIGTFILVIDEATGCAPSILNVVNSNLKPGNVGHFQVVYLGNPNSHFDTFGIAATPEHGWGSVTIEDEEWDTVTGGTVIRFNAEKNPRITEKNEAFSWMLREEDITRMIGTYGRESLYVYRMVFGFWSPQGTEIGVYSEADMIQSGAMGKTVWGLQTPKTLSGLDPSFVNGGDRASCWFAKLGLDIDGKLILEFHEEITLKADIGNTEVPVSYQLVRQWRNECQRRGVPPENACYDSTGGGITFGAIVATQWSARVQGISSGGKASSLPFGTEKDEKGEKLRCCDRYVNKATEIWYGAHPFLRSGQIRGVTTDLAKEICQRQHDKASGGRTLKVESKRLYKSRQGNSPDSSDAFFLVIEHAKTKHGFKPSERAAAPQTRTTNTASVGTWKAFCEKARRLTQRPTLR